MILNRGLFIIRVPGPKDTRLPGLLAGQQIRCHLFFNFRLKLLELRPTDAEKIQTVRTSQGVQISSSHLQTATTHIEHYSLSQPDGEMTEKTARILLRLVPQLSQAIPASRLIAGHRGVFHLLVYKRSHEETFSAAKAESLRP